MVEGSKKGRKGEKGREEGRNWQWQRRLRFERTSASASHSEYDALTRARE